MKRRTALIVATLPLIGLAIHYGIHVRLLRLERQRVIATALAARMKPTDSFYQSAVLAAQRQILRDIVPKVHPWFEPNFVSTTVKPPWSTRPVRLTDRLQTTDEAWTVTGIVTYQAETTNHPVQPGQLGQPAAVTWQTEQHWDHARKEWIVSRVMITDVRRGRTPQPLTSPNVDASPTGK